MTSDGPLNNGLALRRHEGTRRNDAEVKGEAPPLGRSLNGFFFNGTQSCQTLNQQRDRQLRPDGELF